jgi:protein SCO1/2
MNAASKSKRIAILIAILFLPSLAYLLLKTGKNNFKHLAIYGPRDVAANGKDTIYHSLPPFSFINQDGQNVTDATYTGRIFVANFFFTSCKTICPEMTIQMNRVLLKFKKNPQILLLSHTVDPEHDSVPVLKNYASVHNIDSKRWALVTGPKKAIYDHARYGYFISALNGDGGPTDFIHDDKLILIDKEKHIRGYYDGTKPKEVNRLLDEINVLLGEYKEKEGK